MATVGQRLAIDGEIDRLAHAQVLERVLVQRRAVLGGDVQRLVAHVELDVEDIDGVDGLHVDLGVALERIDIGGGNAADQVELSGLQLRDAGGIVGDLLADVTRPRLLRAPEAVVARQDEVAFRLPRNVLVRPGADRGLAGVERLVGGFLGQPGRSFRGDDEQADEVVGQVGRGTIGHDVHGERIDDLGFLHPPHVDGRRIGTRHDRDALDRELDVLRGEVGAVVELDAAAQLELPGRVVERLPAFGQTRLELQAVARPDQRIEHVLQRLGVRAGRGEVRIDRVGTAAHPDGEGLRKGRRDQRDGAQQSDEQRAHGFLPGSRGGCRPPPRE